MANSLNGLVLPATDLGRIDGLPASRRNRTMRSCLNCHTAKRMVRVLYF